MTSQNSDFWWKSITGPQAFVKNVADTLFDRRMPLLNLPADMPWRDSMRNVALEYFLETYPGEAPYIEPIDATDECPNGNIGEFLLNLYASRDVASGYRPRSGRSIQQYLIENGVLGNKILWIKGIAPEAMPGWVNFCQDYTSHSLSSGLFVIENCSSELPVAWDKLDVIDLNQFVSRYDLQLFNSFLQTDRPLSTSNPWKNYIAVAAAQLCEFDAELSEALMLHADWRETDPRAILRELANEPRFAQRGTGYDCNHILAHLRGNREDELNKRLWAAQIQILFPAIEMQRVRIIDRLGKELTEILRNNNIEQFKRRIEDPQELELGTIVYLLAQKDQCGNRGLYMPDENLRNSIYLLRDCRNLLAHQHKCCTPEQVDSLLSIDEN